MKEAMSRDRVKGFLDVRGRDIINSEGQPVLLNGWALGNWLHSEGYMWLCDVPRFDRPRRMEGVIEELVGKNFVDKFWTRYRENYITESDIQMMAEMGCNSLRVPINARLLMREGPGIQFIDEGFQLLDRLVDWCENCGVYVLIDLHAAPGGQTVSNIDDSVDDICRLFSDQNQFEKGLALWEKLAERYAERWIVGGYGLLNRPIRPVRFEGDVPLEGYIPRLVAFYEQCIARIREHDKRHILVLEGPGWGESMEIFDHSFDERMVIGFHRYGCVPDITSFRECIDVSEKLNVPLLLFTGENRLEWYSAMLPLAAELNIGFNIWTWKKMGGENSPCLIQSPRDWNRITEYILGGPHPGYDEAGRILNGFLQNIQIDHCTIIQQINANVHLIPGCVIAGPNFDELPGSGKSYSHGEHVYPAVDYRRDTGMYIFRRFPERKKRINFDGEWAQYVLRLGAGDFACYTLNEITAHSGLEINCWCDERPSVLEVYQDDRLIETFELSAMRYRQTLCGIRLDNTDCSVIKLRMAEGVADVESLVTQADD